MPGSVAHLNSSGLHYNSAFSQVVVTRGAVKTIYVGGQNATSQDGSIVGKDDIGAQTKKPFQNLEAALNEADAGLEHLIKLTVYLVHGQPLQSGFEVYRRVWGERPNPPLVTVVFVSGLADPDFLVEVEALAVLPE